MSSTIRSARLARLFVVLAAASSLTGAAAAVSAVDAEAARCEVRNPSPLACADIDPNPHEAP